jgi:Fur family peroxide stress response transcriptional regulator
MEHIKSILKESGLKITVQRLLVYQALEKLKHAPVDEVVKEVHLTLPTITIAAVYNILELYAKEHIIGRMHTTDNKLFYDITSTPHSHLYASTERRIEDFMDDELKVLVTDYLQRKKIKGFQLDDVNIQIIGHFAPAEMESAKR